MAKHILYDAVVTINGVTLTDHARKITFSVGTNKPPAAAMGEVQDYSLPGTLMIKPIVIEYYQDYAASNVYITHRTIWDRSEEHTSELQSHSFISYAVFCLKKKK